MSIATRVKFRPSSASDFCREVFASRKFDDEDVPHVCDILESLLSVENIPPDKHINFLHSVRNIAESYMVELGPWTPVNEINIPYGRKVLYPKKLIRKATSDYHRYIPGDVDFDNQRGMVTLNIMKRAYVCDDDSLGVGVGVGSGTGKGDIFIPGIVKGSEGDASSPHSTITTHRRTGTSISDDGGFSTLGKNADASAMSTFTGVTPINPDDLRSLADTSARYMKQKTREELNAAKEQAELLLREASTGVSYGRGHERGGGSDDRKRDRHQHQQRRQKERKKKGHHGDDIQILHYRVPPSLYATELPVHRSRISTSRRDSSIYDDPSSEHSSESDDRGGDGGKARRKGRKPMSRGGGGGDGYGDESDSDSEERAQEGRSKKRTTSAPVPTSSVGGSGGSSSSRRGEEDSSASLGDEDSIDVI